MTAVILGMLTQALLPVGGTIISSLVSWGLLEFKNYIKTRSMAIEDENRREAANDAVSHICHTAETIVKDLEQTVAKAYKAMNADGKLTKDQQNALKNIAISRVKTQVPAALLETAQLVVNSVNELIASKIEKAVLEMKN
ncbi:MAG: hypothetical protein ABIK15_07225 [Pseudomonadota bacterium]